MRQAHKDWFDANGDLTYRLDYPLTKDSVVFDIGGYKGDFADRIFNKFGCHVYIFEPIPAFYEKIVARFIGNPKIIPVRLALSDQSTIATLHMQADSTGMIAEGEIVRVPTITFKEALQELDIHYVDLLKLNIEGGEYPVLVNMLKDDMVERCGNIQVQFHTNIQWYETLYTRINKALIAQGFELTWRFPFVWENWRKKER